MLISVITLAYNSQSTIMQTIDSVLKQDYGEIEYIISDDGTIGFDAKKYEDYVLSHNRGNIKGVKVISHSENVGTVRNLNNGIKQSTGEIIFTLSADDVFADEKVISDWVNEFKDKKANVITAKRAVYDADMQKRIDIEPVSCQIKKIQNSSSEELFEYIAPKNIIFGSCTARTRESINKYGYFDEKYKYIEDYPMNLKMLRQGEKIHFFDRVVINYRSSGISAALKVDEGYLNENYSIFENEGLPFVKNKGRAVRKYKKWKKSLKLARRYAWLKSELKRKKFFGKVKACILFYFIWYPHLTAIKPFKKFFALFKSNKV